jgi:hypothetical protein
MNAPGSRDTEGFGCPRAVDPHHFRIEIPSGRSGIVLIAEHYGIKAGLSGLPEVAERCHLPRPIWSLIAEEVKRVFNERLQAKKMKTGRWQAGANKVERLLGKELLVLAWAVEKAAPDLVPNAVRNWIGLRPEERWWLYTAAAAATGHPHQSETGWRKALRFALTENPLEDLASLHKPPAPLRTRDGTRNGQPKLPGFLEEPSPFLENGRKGLLAGKDTR